MRRGAHIAPQSRDACGKSLCGLGCEAARGAGTGHLSSRAWSHRATALAAAIAFIVVSSWHRQKKSQDVRPCPQSHLLASFPAEVERG